MIREVIRQINQRIDLTFEDKKLDLVYPVLNKTDWLPGSQDGLVYKDAVPDSSKRSILYWEDYGGRVVDSCARYQRFAHQIRVVVWFNFAMISKPYDDCVVELLRAIPRRFNGVTLKPVGYLPKKNDIFARYSYRDEKQYVTYPYDVVAIDFEVKYMSTLCPVDYLVIVDNEGNIVVDTNENTLIQNG